MIPAHVGSPSITQQYGDIKVKVRIGLALHPVRTECLPDRSSRSRPSRPVEHDSGVLPERLSIPEVDDVETSVPKVIGGEASHVLPSPGVEYLHTYATQTGGRVIPRRRRHDCLLG